MADLVLKHTTGYPHTIDTPTGADYVQDVQLDYTADLVSASLYVFHRTEGVQLLEGEPLAILDPALRRAEVKLLGDQDMIQPGVVEVHVQATFADGAVLRYPGRDALHLNLEGDERRVEKGILLAAQDAAIDARNEAEAFRDQAAEAAVSPSGGTTWGAVVTRPTSTSFTNLQGEDVTISEGESVYVIDEGVTLVYDPADPAADPNGYVEIGTPVLLQSSLGTAGGPASLDNDGFVQQRPLTVVQTPLELRDLPGKPGAAAQMVERGNDTFTWQATGSDDDYETFTSNTGGAWVRNQRTKVITPTMVGAVGDGIADDRPALQYMFGEAAARNYQVDLEGRTWWILSANSAQPDYGLLLTDGLRLRNGRIQGDGATYLVGDPDTSPAREWIFEDVVFDGRNTADTLINISNGYGPYIRLSRCVFLRATNMGFNIQTFVADILGCRVSDAQVGFRINQCTSLNMMNNYAQDCTIGYETGSVRYSNWAANAADFCTDAGYSFGTASGITFQGGCESSHKFMRVGNAAGLNITSAHCFNMGLTSTEDARFPASPPDYFIEINDEQPVVIGEIRFTSTANEPNISKVKVPGSTGGGPGNAGRVTYLGSLLDRDDFALEDGSARVVMAQELSGVAGKNLVANGDLLVWPGTGEPPAVINPNGTDCTFTKKTGSAFDVGREPNLQVDATVVNAFFEVDLTGLESVIAGREIRAGFLYRGSPAGVNGDEDGGAESKIEWDPGTGFAELFPNASRTYINNNAEATDSTWRVHEVRGVAPIDLDSTLRWQIQVNGAASNDSVVHFSQFWLSIGARPAYGSDRPIEHTAELNQTISGTPTQAEVQAISDKVDELLFKLETSQKMLTE